MSALPSTRKVGTTVLNAPNVSDLDSRSQRSLSANDSAVKVSFVQIISKPERRNLVEALAQCNNECNGI